MADLTAIILTRNEEKNIGLCIQSIRELASRIVVIDSFSEDRTAEISRELGAEVHFHEFVNYATQFLYGLNEMDISTKWILRIDADERLTRDSAAEIEELCRVHGDTDVNGLILRFGVNFMGRELRHGGIYPFRKLLVFKRGIGTMENRNMDEHIILSKGRAIEVKHDSEHHDYKDLTYWTQKHNGYASREVMDYFEYKKNKNQAENQGELKGSAKAKRWIKFHIYYNLPIGMRAHFYYLYRYYVKLGFLDGTEGRIFAFLQAYWYRFLVDAKIYEVEHEKDINRDR